jgi:RNA polymerase sigma factor FliA
MSDIRLRPVWDRYLTTRDAEARGVLFDGYAKVAYSIALACASLEGPDELEFEDYLHFGIIGLIEAIERFDPTRGTRFDQYALHRIRGAILNGTENFSELRKQIASHGFDWQQEHDCFSPEVVDDTDEHSSNLGLDETERRQMCNQMTAIVERLSEQQREVVRQHYYQEIKFTEIAQALGVTKGRISQIHKSALDSLKKSLITA